MAMVPEIKMRILNVSNVLEPLTPNVEKLLLPGGSNSTRTLKTILPYPAEDIADPRDLERANSGWFHWLYTCLNFLFLVQQVPFTVAFESRRYKVRTSRFRTVPPNTISKIRNSCYHFLR